jgi:hypothetical protein
MVQFLVPETDVMGKRNFMTLLFKQPVLQGRRAVSTGGNLGRRVVEMLRMDQ